MEEGKPSPPPSSGGLLSSGKVVAEATMAAFQERSVEKVDKKAVAGASAELLDSASRYGKLEGKPVGEYMEKAEVYLKQYGSGADEAKPTANAPAPEPEPAAGKEEPAPAADTEEGKPSGGFGVDDVVEKSAGAGAGGLFKMAQGFMK